MKEVIEYISANYLSIAGTVWVALTAIAAITPSDKDDTILEKVGAFADRFGIKLKGK